MKFNLKKHAEETINKKLEEKRENNDHLDSQNILLEKLRKDEKGDSLIEAQLSSIRDKDLIWNSTTEANIDNYKVSDGLPARNGEDQHDVLPINALEEKAHQDKIKAYKKAEDVDSDFYSGPEQPNSQLHNSVERFKGNKVREMTMASLKDADAMLYHIYLSAATDKREFTALEQSLIKGITQDKIQLMEKLNGNI